MAYQSIPPTTLDDITPTMGAAATTLTFSNMNGDAVGDYRFDFHLNIAQANCSITLRPNAVTTNQLGFGADRLAGGANRTDFAFAKAAVSPMLFASGDSLDGWGYIRARSGRIRYFRLEAFADIATNDVFEIFGEWTDTTTNLTSIDFTAGVASGIGTGSWIRVMKIFTRT